MNSNCGKSHLLTTCDYVEHINIGGGNKYEELLDILRDNKLTFENHLLNIVQKINQKLHTLIKISKYMPQKKLGFIMKAFVSSQHFHIAH